MTDFKKLNWQLLDCAFQHLANEIPNQLGRIMDTHDLKEVHQIMGELINNVGHQTSFYNSTMVVMNYLADFIKARADELEYALTLTSYFASFYCWEKKLVVDDKIQRKHNKSVRYVKKQLLNFIENDFDNVVAFAQDSVFLILIAILSLLDTNQYSKKFAQALSYGESSEVSILCCRCEFEDETMPIDDESLVRTSIGNEVWNHHDFSNTALWVQNLLKDNLNDEMVNWVLVLAGTFICPDCGAKQSTIKCVLNFAENR